MRHLLALLFVLAWSAPSYAELVYFRSGRALSVKSYRVEGDTLVLRLRSGGEVACSRELIARIEPDEVEYPEETLASRTETATLAEAAAVPEAFRELIAASAERYGVDERLVHAVIQVESGYRSHAVSPKGAVGLMQLMPATARQYGARDLRNPQVNVDAGIRHLKSLLQRFDLPMALAAYNAGEGAVRRFGGIPPFRETRQYVSRILELLAPR